MIWTDVILAVTTSRSMSRACMSALMYPRRSALTLRRSFAVFSRRGACAKTFLSLFLFLFFFLFYRYLAGKNRWFFSKLRF